MKYHFRQIEQKWQKRWLEEKSFQAREDSGKPKYYQLETFPYPSAEGLHVGHPKGYIAEDIHARYMRMNGREVLYTMGWDAFGLPTENYALKIGKTPNEVAKANVANFKRQVRMFGLSYDWDREINTSTPEYYKWTQWLFIQFFKKGLAYQASANVNWCPNCETVLANEQVEGGACWRCNTPVVQKQMEQWFLKITDYAERLQADLKGLDWPEATIKRQRDWIGKSEGALLEFPIQDSSFRVRVFTTRPDTLFGATFMVLAPEHPLIENLKLKIENWGEIQKYIEQARHKTELMRKEEREKTGLELKGVKAMNPATKEEIPIFIADYVLMGYGTGAVMGVPAHDERDYEFAKRHELPMRTVVEPLYTQSREPGKIAEGVPFDERDAIIAIVKHWSEEKYMALKWKKVAWGTFLTGGVEKGQTAEEAAKAEIKEETGYLNPALVKDFGIIHGKFYHVPKNVNRFAHARVLYFELRDDAQGDISDEERQIHEILWLSTEELAKFLTPDTHQHALRMFLGTQGAYEGEGVLTNSGEFNGMDTGTGRWEIAKFVGGARRIQYKIRDWSVSRQRYWGVPIPMIHCATCGAVPVPESDLPVLLPKDVDYRPKGKPPLASSEKFMNVKCPKCGGEARRDPETLDTFVDSSWYYLRYTDPKNEKEIFNKDSAAHWLPVDLYVIGAEHTVLHLLYSRFITKFLYDEGYVSFTEPFTTLRHQGLVLGADGQKMSKSKGNVVNPDDLIAEFGADTVRLYEMFMGPFENGQPWDPQGVLGTHRFLHRFWSFMRERISSSDFASAETPRIQRAAVHKGIKKVGEDIAGFKFNTAVSSLMILLNELEGAAIGKRDVEAVLKLLHPFAPHVAQELWEMAGYNTILDFEAWPAHDPDLIVKATFRLVIQINGKVRDTVEAPAGVSEEEAARLSLQSARVTRALGGIKPRKVIYVKDRLINFVL